MSLENWERIHICKYSRISYHPLIPMCSPRATKDFISSTLPSKEWTTPPRWKQETFSERIWCKSFSAPRQCRNSGRLIKGLSSVSCNVKNLKCLAIILLCIETDFLIIIISAKSLTYFFWVSMSQKLVRSLSNPNSPKATILFLCSSYRRIKRLTYSCGVSNFDRNSEHLVGWTPIVL